MLHWPTSCPQAQRKGCWPEPAMGPRPHRPLTLGAGRGLRPRIHLPGALSYSISGSCECAAYARRG